MNYYNHTSEGILTFDYGRDTKYYEPWWAIVTCDPGIVAYYAWLSKRYGIPVMKNKAYGAHISFNKGEEPPNKEAWGLDRAVRFQYASVIRTDNNFHAWLDVWSDDLIQIREQLGFPPKLKMSYHLTLGRLS